MDYAAHHFCRTASIMASKDPMWKLFISQTLLDRLQAMRELTTDVRQNEDIEAIHQMRVASRRLRAAIDVSNQAITKKQRERWYANIQKITSSLGRSRDLDVQIDFVAGYLEKLESTKDRPGIERLLLRLRQSRERYQPKVVNAIDRFEQNPAIEKMAKRLHEMILDASRATDQANALGPFKQAGVQINKKIEELHAYRPFVDRPTMNTQLHEMRLCAKRLRYTLEVFGPTYPDNALGPATNTARKLQNLLGKIHDCDNWIDMLPVFYTAESKRHEDFLGHRRGLKRIETAIENLTAYQVDQRRQAYEKFASFWHKTDQRGLWQELDKILSGAETTQPESPAVRRSTPGRATTPKPAPTPPAAIDITPPRRATRPVEN